MPFVLKTYISTNPNSDGIFVLENVEYGEHHIYARLFSFGTDIITVHVTEAGLEGVEFTLNWRCELAGSQHDTIGPGTCYVVDDIWVLSTNSVTILPGTRLEFEGHFRFSVYGQLTAMGAIDDSIYFSCDTTIYSTGWSGLRFIYSGSQLHSTLSFCVIENCRKPGEGGDGWGDRHGAGIYCQGEISLSISNSAIRYNRGIDRGGGIGLLWSASPDITNCAIEYNSAREGGGIGAEGSFLNSLTKCQISRNTATYQGSAIWTSSYAIEDTTWLSNCTVANNFTALGGYTIHWWGGSSSVHAINSIFAFNSGPALAQSMSHCNYIENPDPEHPFGALNYLNANGDSCDAYFNVSIDPLFVDPDNGDYHLQMASPCIDAGDPELLCDPDYTVSDIGAFYFHRNDLPLPDDLVISMDDQNATLAWSPAIRCEPDSTIEVAYLIFYENDSNEEFGFLAFTTDTFFVHEHVVQFEETMYYEVRTYIGALDVLYSIAPETKMTEVELTLSDR